MSKLAESTEISKVKKNIILGNVNKIGWNGTKRSVFIFSGRSR